MKKSATLAILLLLGAATYSSAQEEGDGKLKGCRQDANQLIGATREALRTRCGTWARSNTTHRPGGLSEQIVYGYQRGPFMYVYLEDGIVSAVHAE